MLKLLTVLALIMPFGAAAQQRDSVFSDYAAYSEFVDRHIMARDFTPLILTLGGRDEYTPQQLANTDFQLKAAFPENFSNSAVFHSDDLGNRVTQEGRIYWHGDNYAFFYAIYHLRDDGLVVLNFNLNSEISSIMEKF